MPRVIQSSLFSSPSNDLGQYGGNPSSRGGVDTSSVTLSCLGPNGRAVHSLAIRNGAAYIDTHSLPLTGTIEDVSDVPSQPVVHTRLPERVQTALNRYPPMELVCVDVDSPQAQGENSHHNKIPLLCLYTKKDVFVLDLEYPSNTGAPEVEGVVIQVSEPMDEILLGTSTSCSIVRIRPAPQRRDGFATMCPPACMAMLTYDSITNEYSLHVHHGSAGSAVGTPLVYGMEQVEGDQDERITDFCFCQSNAFGLLSSLSTAFLKGSGDVLVATPILFRGTVVPRLAVTQTVEYLNMQLQQFSPQSAAWRQYKSAKQFVMDVFPDDGRSHYLTAQVRSAALEWPVQMQGPVLIAAESDDYETLASALEPILAGDLVGLAIGHVGDMVDFGLLSPTTMIPRFRLESDQDTMKLDDDLKWGTVVQRVDLGEEESEHQPVNTRLALVRDPVMDTVVHYVTPTNIKSISTNAIKLCASKVREQAGVAPGMFSPQSKLKDAGSRTTAWSCLDVSNTTGERVSITGAVVSGDAHLGHVLVARLSNGSMIPINLTETRHYHEMEALSENSDRLAIQGASASDLALRSLHDIAPLHELLQPLFQKIGSGLAGMGKIVGSATQKKDITPELLAVSMSVKERCDNEVVLPVLEMTEIVSARQKELEIMYANQLAQLKTLKETVALIKEKMGAIREKAEVAGTNAKSLAQRSAAALQSSTDLMPTITQAEYDFFQELKKLDNKTKEWQEEFERINLKVSGLRDSVDEGDTSGPLTLTSDAVLNAKKLLQATGAMQKKHTERLDEAEERIDELAAVAGIDLEPEKPLPASQ